MTTKDDIPHGSTPEYIKAPEVARMLGYRSRRTIDRLVAAGEIPHIKLPTGAIRFKVAEIERWADSYSVHIANTGG